MSMPHVTTEPLEDNLGLKIPAGAIVWPEEMPEHHIPGRLLRVFRDWNETGRTYHLACAPGMVMLRMVRPATEEEAVKHFEELPTLTSLGPSKEDWHKEPHSNFMIHWVVRDCRWGFQFHVPNRLIPDCVWETARYKFGQQKKVFKKWFQDGCPSHKRRVEEPAAEVAAQH